MKKYDFTAAFIVPTGVGAAIGGFAGDAGPAANLISKICPVIVNPNVVNAGIFSSINDNMLYTEGYFIDSFFKGEIALRPSNHNKIGVIFDKAIPENIFNIHINTLNALESVYGIKIKEIAVTEESVGVDFSISESGISTGVVNNTKTLLEAGAKLIINGADALAVVCYFGEADDENYSSGIGVDPIGGVEAVISHLLAKELQVPVAHSPAFNETQIPLKIVDKRASAEYISSTYLPCIILGLYNAPQIIKISDAESYDITLNNIKALIMPYDCLGCLPVLKAAENNIPIIAVEDNKTVLDITAKSLGIEDKVIIVKNYPEAAEYLTAMREGTAVTL